MRVSLYLLQHEDRAQRVGESGNAPLEGDVRTDLVRMRVAEWLWRIFVCNLTATLMSALTSKHEAYSHALEPRLETSLLVSLECVRQA